MATVWQYSQQTNMARCPYNLHHNHAVNATVKCSLHLWQKFMSPIKLLLQMADTKTGLFVAASQNRHSIFHEVVHQHIKVWWHL